jgi:hypothetical protein
MFDSAGCPPIPGDGTATYPYASPVLSHYPMTLPPPNPQTSRQRCDSLVSSYSIYVYADLMTEVVRCHSFRGGVLSSGITTIVHRSVFGTLRYPLLSIVLDYRYTEYQSVQKDMARHMAICGRRVSVSSVDDRAQCDTVDAGGFVVLVYQHPHRARQSAPGVVLRAYPCRVHGPSWSDPMIDRSVCDPSRSDRVCLTGGAGPWCDKRLHRQGRAVTDAGGPTGSGTIVPWLIHRNGSPR